VAVNCHVINSRGAYGATASIDESCITTIHYFLFLLIKLLLQTQGPDVQNINIS